MKKLSIWLLVFSFILLFQPVLYSSTLTLKSVVSVSGDKVYLRDILEDPSGVPDGFLLTELFPSPPIGRTIVYSSQYVRQIILMKLPSLAKDREITAPDKITFIRRSQVILNNELISMIKEQLNLRDVEPLSSVPDIILPEGDLKTEMKLLSSGNSRVIVVKVSFFVDGKNVKTVNLSLKTSIKRIVYVASKFIQKGVIITEDMITEKVIENDVPYSIVSREEIIGKITTRAIYPGQIITSSYIAEEPLVKKNQEVEVIRRIDNLTITTVFIALQDGYLGQTIRLRNPISFKEVLGTVTGRGKVEVFR